MENQHHASILDANHYKVLHLQSKKNFSHWSSFVIVD